MTMKVAKPIRFVYNKENGERYNQCELTGVVESTITHEDGPPPDNFEWMGTKWVLKEKYPDGSAAVYWHERFRAADRWYYGLGNVVRIRGSWIGIVQNYPGVWVDNKADCIWWVRSLKEKRLIRVRQSEMEPLHEVIKGDCEI